MIFGITFSMTVRIPYMRYECNFFNIEQIQHQICEKCAMHYGGGAKDVMIYTNVKFSCQNRDFDIEMYHHIRGAPPIRPPMNFSHI